MSTPHSSTANQQLLVGNDSGGMTGLCPVMQLGFPWYCRICPRQWHNDLHLLVIWSGQLDLLQAFLCLGMSAVTTTCRIRFYHLLHVSANHFNWLHFDISGLPDSIHFHAPHMWAYIKSLPGHWVHIPPSYSSFLSGQLFNGYQQTPRDGKLL